MLENYQYQDMNHHPSFKELQSELFPQRRKKIMVIDDDQDFRLSVCELLVDEGFSVTTAKDGETGLNSLIHQPDLPDLILVDLMMPVKSGLEFRREQLQLDEISDIPVMFMTGHGYVDGERCLLKPFDEREFIAEIKRSIV
ncbi:response regulator [Peredibacter sp. HCB2-198]|uniref:response regulator n=1 Tax=Peredibacter sp. HCB2-198 TaxID=3383025 RepID=UPI0038B41C09